jgi:Phage portal protein, lambda family
VKKPLLYGPNGKPLAQGMYPSTRNNRRAYRPRPFLNRDTKRNVTAIDRSELVTNSRLLFSRIGNLGTSITDKNSWAFGDGWDAHYTGTNEPWGLAATAFLKEQFYPNCDRHGRYDFKMCLYLSGIAWDRDGDDLMILTEDKNGSGFPKLEFITSERINSGNAVGNKVVGGAYDGNEIFDGIIFEDGTPVAARVLGEQPANGSAIEVYEDIPIGFGGKADLAYLPEWHDQGRGVPLVARPSLDCMDLEDIDEFLKRGIKRASEVGLVSKTAEGEARVGNEIMTEVEVTAPDGTTQNVTYEEVGEGGGIYYMRKDGEELKGLDFKNPHENVENFIKRIERRCIKSVGWFYELINLAESGRAAMRLVCDLANQSIWKQQSLGLRRTWRATRYALAKAQKHGFLPRNPDAHDAYFNWDFGLPKGMSVDAGNDEMADRENLKMGTTSKAILAQKKGFFQKDIQRQRKAEILTNAQDAADIEKTTGGKITFDKALDLLEQRAPNPVQTPLPAPEKS